MPGYRFFAPMYILFLHQVVSVSFINRNIHSLQPSNIAYDFKILPANLIPAAVLGTHSRATLAL